MLRKILEFTETAIGYLVRLLLVIFALSLLLIAGLKYADAAEVQWAPGDTVHVVVWCKDMDSAVTLFSILEKGALDARAFPACETIGRNMWSVIIDKIHASTVDHEGDTMLIFSGRDTMGNLIEYPFIGWPDFNAMISKGTHA